MMRCADRHQRGVVVADRGDHRELVAAEPRHQVVAAQRVREPQRDVADQLVADRMAERVVDVLEVVEIDIEHRGRRGARAHLLDHRFEPLAEEDAVGQAAQRIVDGQMAQPRFADGDGDRGAAHLAQHEGREQREAGERDADERDDAVDDLGARLPRRPGEARDRIALRVGQLEVKSGGGAGPSSTLRRCVSRSCAAMSASTSLSMNFTDIRIGAAWSPEPSSPPSGPTATAAMTAGRPASARITAACACGPSPAPSGSVRRSVPCEAGLRPRI